MLRKLLKILTIKVSNWVGILVYTVALIEAILMVVHYFNPDLLFKVLMRL